MNGIADKVVVLTGGSSGIGAATAKLLCARGAKLVIGARGLPALKQVAEEIQAVGGKVRYRQTDVTKREDLTALVREAEEHFGGVDVLINNAGAGPISLLDELRVEDWDSMIDINIKGTLYGIAAVLPIFRAKKSGHIINIISTAGLQIVPTMAVYAASKNAVRTLTEGLRLEAKGDFRVTGISPGFVKTNFVNSMTNETIKNQIKGRMDEMGLDPNAIARAIAFAIEAPADTGINDITIRPTVQT